MAALGRIEIAHRKYSDGKFGEALELYTQALDAATLPSQRVALYSNRAACFLRLQRFREAADECGAVLAIDRNHTRALMLRAQTFIALKDYQSALFDVTRLIEIDPSSPAYRDLKARLRTQVALTPIPESDEEYLVQSPPESPSSKASRSLSPTSVLEPSLDKSSEVQAPKPKSVSVVDYSKWSNIGDDLSDEEEEEEAPQYRYRLRTVGLRAVNF